MSVEPTGILRGLPGTNGIERVADNSRGRHADGAHGTDVDQPSTFIASDLRPYLAAGRSASAEREERVAALRAAIASGSYDVSIDALAKKLLGNGR
jgi:anti-sigma28 factor (negative regulator of flagellin synthesis)